MANLFSSIIFGARNADKTVYDNPARFPVFVGQCTNAAKEIAKYDKEFAKSFNFAKGVCPAVSKVIDFASKNVNPLICVAGGVKVLTADDKKSELVNQTAALGTMFCAEKSYKALMDCNHIAKIAEKIGQSDNLLKLANCSVLKNIKDKVGDKRFSFILNAIYGIGFVATSITGYNIGEKIAKKINSSRKELQQTQALMASNQRNFAVC